MKDQGDEMYLVFRQEVPYDDIIVVATAAQAMRCSD